MLKVTIMGIDPSMRNIGWCLGTYKNGRHSMEAVGTIITKPTKKNYKVEEHFQSANDMLVPLSKLVEKYAPSYIYFEYPTGSKSSSALISYAFTLMMMASIKKQFPSIVIEGIRVPIIKTMFGGHRHAEKEFITARAYDLTAEASGWKVDKVKQPLKNMEHAADAVATYFVGSHIKGFHDIKFIPSEVKLKK